MALKARSEEGDGKDNGEDKVGGREGRREARGMGGGRREGRRTYPRMPSPPGRARQWARCPSGR